MNISPRKYAQGLYESVCTQQNDKQEINKILEKFVELIIKNEDLAKIDSILYNFSKIYNFNTGILEADVVSKFDLNDELIVEIKDYVKQKTNFKDIKINKKIDKNILGGIVVKYDDKVLDLSLRNRLKQLKQQMIQ